MPGSSAGSGSSSLSAIAATSTNDVWAVGVTSSAMNSNVNQTFVEHWNGTSWSIVSSPNAGSLGSSLTGVTTVSATDAWAVGNFPRTLIEHWNGSTWSIVSSPNDGTNWNVLQGVKSVSATNAWAVGYFTNSSGVNQTLIEQWNGASWKVVSSPNAGNSNNFLQAVTQTSGTGQVWAVGSYEPTIHHPNQKL